MSTVRVREAPLPSSLPIMEGPWNSDVWLIERPVPPRPSGDVACAVATCSGLAGRAQGQKARSSDVLCASHKTRLRKARQGHDIERFIAEQALARPILEARGVRERQTHFSPIDFTKVPESFADEIRYIAGIKIARNHWTSPSYTHKVVVTAVEIGARIGATTLRGLPSTEAELAKFLTDGADRARTMPGVPLNGPHMLALALPSMIAHLDDAADDPWTKDIWHPAELKLPDESARYRRNISWKRVSCGWLRDGAKKLCKEYLQAGKRSWTTISSYSKACALMSRFLESEVGQIASSDLDRTIYLQFLAWVRDDSDATTTDLRSVNTLARLLIDLRATGTTPDLPDTPFLRRNENPIEKTRAPRPFPSDILAQIDALVSDPAVGFPEGVRLLLRLFRAACPRAQEALTLTRDCLSHVEGQGYTLQYFQTKTQEWRRVPLPPKLGEDLAAQSIAVAERYGQACNFLFPYAGPGSKINPLLDRKKQFSPWPYSSFTSTVWDLYSEYGIKRSTLTGEVLNGPQLHRFRHSTATGLLNEGWSQYEVQTFLGHKSPTMMQAYAKIHDDTLRDKYIDFIENSVDSSGARALVDEESLDVERLRDRLTRSTLADGYCTLPEKLNCDFIPSPCLSCAFFRTTPVFLPIHIRRRDEALVEIELSKEQGRTRATQAHEQTVERLDVIIDALQKDPTVLQALP
ncbi:MAG: hypothetical protein JWR85_4153 [Marmoricola sp.]|nr:hypothetical protein [Marmoricola sp.]